MPKKQILSKFKIKDYNAELEKILEEKDFSSQVKNLLLSMFYKLEIGYNDYEIVKHNVPSKEVFMEYMMGIIKEKCNEIEIILPNENDEKKYQVFKEEKKILSYQNESAMLHAILEMDDYYFVVKDEENIINLPIQTMLKEGYVLNIKEALTNFDGWAWNNNLDKTDRIDYYVVYICLKILMGSFFMSEWKKNQQDRRNYLEEIQKKSKTLYEKLCELCILLLCSKSEGKKIVKENVKKLNAELNRMEEKTEFLKEIYEEKSEIEKYIRHLSEVINNSDMLKEEFLSRNSHLSKDNKIFSISDLSDMLQEEMQECSNKLEEKNRILLPKNYLKKIKSIEEKLEIIQNCNLSKTNAQKIYEKEIEFHDCFLEIIKKEINNIKDRKEMMNLIYNYRYYMYLPIQKQNEIILMKDVPELKEKIDLLFKKIITKACKMNVIIIVNEDIGRNYRIVKQILDTKLIKLEDIFILFLNNKENIEIQVYDGEILDKTYSETKDNIKDFRIKFGKKIKIFT